MRGTRRGRVQQTGVPEAQQRRDHFGGSHRHRTTERRGSGSRENGSQRVETEARAAADPEEQTSAFVLGRVVRDEAASCFGGTKQGMGLHIESAGTLGERRGPARGIRHEIVMQEAEAARRLTESPRQTRSTHPRLGDRTADVAVGVPQPLERVVAQAVPARPQSHGANAIREGPAFDSRLVQGVPGRPRKSAHEMGQDLSNAPSCSLTVQGADDDLETSGNDDTGDGLGSPAAQQIPDSSGRTGV